MVISKQLLSLPATHNDLNDMRQPLLIGIFLGCVFCFLDAHARHPVFAELERVLGRRAVFTRQKEARIDSLNRQFHPDMDLRDRFRWCQSIYEEYHTYRFDSAMHYVKQETELAEALNDTDLQNLCRIHRSVLLATAGYFSESVQNLQAISSATLLLERRVDYYTAYEWAYSMWAEYSDDQVYAPTYYRQDYRSAVKNRARQKEDFEKQVEELCTM